jgi:molybdenum cofactor cytidylyltransferase
VIVVTGAHHTEIDACLAGLPVTVVQNTNYTQGQSSSIKAGLQKVPDNNGACIFLLADQPQTPPEVIRALVESHSRELSPIVAPLVLEERRANPVLFDKITFADLLNLEGDTGGKAIFSKYKVEYLPWHDDRLLLDVDKPEDYQRLVEDDTL